MLQHGVAVMMWQMFVAKKVSATAYLVEKVSICFYPRAICDESYGGLGKKAFHLKVLIKMGPTHFY